MAVRDQWARPGENPKAGVGERIPWIQYLLDDVFLLLLLGTCVPLLMYIVWGLMELSNVPVMR